MFHYCLLRWNFSISISSDRQSTKVKPKDLLHHSPQACVHISKSYWVHWDLLPGKHAEDWNNPRDPLPTCAPIKDHFTCSLEASASITDRRMCVCTKCNNKGARISSNFSWTGRSVANPSLLHLTCGKVLQGNQCPGGLKGPMLGENKTFSTQSIFLDTKQSPQLLKSWTFASWTHSYK